MQVSASGQGARLATAATSDGNEAQSSAFPPLQSSSTLGGSGSGATATKAAHGDSLHRAEAALTQCEAAVASANASRSTSPSGRVRPSRENVIAAAAKLVEAKCALNSLKGEVREQLASLQLQFQQEIEAALAMQRPRAALPPSTPHAAASQSDSIRAAAVAMPFVAEADDE